MLCICYGANGDLVMLLTSGIYKHRERAATDLFKGTKQKSHFFQNYFDLRPLWQTPDRPPGKTKERKSDPWGN